MHALKCSAGVIWHVSPRSMPCTRVPTWRHRPTLIGACGGESDMAGLHTRRNADANKAKQTGVSVCHAATCVAVSLRFSAAACGTDRCKVACTPPAHRDPSASRCRCSARRVSAPIAAAGALYNRSRASNAARTRLASARYAPRSSRCRRALPAHCTALRHAHSHRHYPTRPHPRDRKRHGQKPACNWSPACTTRKPPTSPVCRWTSNATDARLKHSVYSVIACVHTYCVSRSCAACTSIRHGGVITPAH
jgi:hypothetical protein